MNKPMVMSEAAEKFQCRQCANSDFSYCGSDCVTGATCSTRCKLCAKSIWFGGSWQEQALMFRCPHCQNWQKHPYPKMAIKWEKFWCIRNKAKEYWSNDWGWMTIPEGEEGEFTIFDDELRRLVNLPMGDGVHWEEFC